jgi:hypothetical protein
MNSLSEVVAIFDVDPFQIGDGDTFRFRLEVLRNVDTNTYKGKVYRLETYRLQPTFPQAEGFPPDWENDALIYVSDDMFDSDKLSGESTQDVVEKFKKYFDEIFTESKGSGTGRD